MPRQRNERLVELLDEAGLTHKGLARRVVERARAVGLEVSYDHNSVRRWLDGDQPRYPSLVVEVLTEALGRRVTAGECGLSGESDPVDVGLEFGLSWSAGLDTATALWRGDVERRRFLIGASYAVAVYPAASMRWLTLHEPGRPTRSSGRRVGRSDIDSITSMTASFRSLDNQVGGGQVRATVAQYLHSSVAPLLRGSYTEPVGAELFAAAAELTKLAGWMAYDQEEHGLAQRYLIQALRLARTGGNAGLGAEILAAMSHQATYVGRPGDAVDLARAAQIGARKAGLAALESECHVVEAHGHAALDDASACSSSLTHAERAFDRSDASPDWLAYYDEAYLSAKIAHCFRDLGDDDRTATYAERSLDMADGYQRGRSFNLCLLAGAHAGDDPLEAVRVGERVADIVEGLGSRRSHSYLRAVRHRLAAHDQIPEVAEFRDRVAAVTARA
ncbi:hypothetical protein CLV30_11774 [Haloactinopolyspora alba]|uniref:Transcriptional regulator n=1 Tax=Haloactinopolyspora alba TaxID=648780 RepID=A0A2P8DRC9_9ACTN|nr:hypothetical protein [Haloactinopolyspora alba]PSK99771.1 hypothetical protein CLV30_11774 [Haloactinopolyspora alba]